MLSGRARTLFRCPLSVGALAGLPPIEHHSETRLFRATVNRNDSDPCSTHSVSARPTSDRRHRAWPGNLVKNRKLGQI